MAISRDEFEEWTHHFITKAFMQTVLDSKQSLVDIAVGSMGVDSVEDNFRRGYIVALNDILNVSVDEVSEKHDA